MTEPQGLPATRRISTAVVIAVLVLVVLQQAIQPLADIIPSLEFANIDDWLTIAMSLATLVLMVAHFARIRNRARWYAMLFFRVDAAPEEDGRARSAASTAATSFVLLVYTVIFYWTVAQGAMFLMCLFVGLSEVYVKTRLCTMAALAGLAVLFLVVMLVKLRPLFRRLRSVASGAQA